MGRARTAGQGEPAPGARGDPLRLVFAGTPAAALPALRAVLSSRHDVAAVVTRPDARAGRGRRTERSPVAVAAEEHGVEVLTPRRPSEPDFLDRLGELRPDCCPVVAYGALVPRAALDVPRHGWVNLHFSLLPAWRGAAPVQHAVLRGDEVTGATVFVLQEGLDTGPVLGTLTEPVRPRDTSGDLLDRLATAGAGLLVAALDLLESGRAEPLPQPDAGVSHAPKITVDDARVRWGDPAVGVDRQVRACTPAPGAWTTFRDARLKLGPVLPAPDADAPGDLEPGSLRVERTRVLAGTATDPVELGTVQTPGGRAVPALDWARGARPGPGGVLT